MDRFGDLGKNLFPHPNVQAATRCGFNAKVSLFGGSQLSGVPIPIFKTPLPQIKSLQKFWQQLAKLSLACCQSKTCNSLIWKLVVYYMLKRVATCKCTLSKLS